MNKFFILILILIPQFTHSQVEKNIRAEAAEIMYKSYCESFNLIGKDCNITFNEFTKYIYLKHHFTLSNTNIRFYFYNSEKYLDEKSFLFVKKDSSYFLYNDFQDSEGTCFTKKTETLFTQILRDQSVTETNIIELINIHLFYRNLNGHIYNFLLPSKPMYISLNNCSYFNIKQENNSLIISFVVWNRLSSDIIEVILQKNINENPISTKKVGNMGTPGIKL
jgi:hypothetical protein